MRQPFLTRGHARRDARGHLRRHASALALGLALAWTAAPVVRWLQAHVAAPERPHWSSLLPAPRVGRLRAALVVDARDCPATLAITELFARPELAGAVAGVTLLVRDGRDSLARYADARLTGAVHVAVVPVPRAMRRAVATLGPGPRLVLVDAAGRVVWAVRAHGATTADPTFVPTLVQVARHHLATELATANTASIPRATPAR